MKPGESERWMCDNCNAEFEITYEPKAKDDERPDLEDAFVEQCPFCGSRSIGEV